MTEQLFFDLDFPDRRESKRRQRLAGKRQSVRRALLRWLYRNHVPTGCATNVPTRITRFRADVAAFWSRAERNPHSEGPGQLLIPEYTALFQCHLDREECWPDCVRSDGDIAGELRQLKQQLEQVEREIRDTEPELRETCSLFDEYAEWRYEDSEDGRYHRLKRQIEKAEHALYSGTKFERIRQAALATHLYLVVPAGVVVPAELADGWGLLWVNDDLSITVKSTPAPRECLRDHRLHLVQNVAGAAAADVLFVNGVRRRGSSYIFVRAPRGHRKPEAGTVDDRG